MEDENKKLEVEEKIKKVLEKIRPYIISDGGDVEYVKFENGVVHVRMVGACMHCPHAGFTLTEGIESALVAEVPEVIKVVNVEE